jgi:hypothetical protein
MSNTFGAGKVMTTTSHEVGERVRQALGESKFSEFRACAYFDEDLDCIRVIARDCSVLETRVNEYLTVLEDHYEEVDDKKYVGFTVKGARHFCQEHHIDLSVPVNIGKVLDQILATSPEPLVQMTIRLVARPLIQREGLADVRIPPNPSEAAYA